ncbi:MAG: hypothetical protein C4584_02065 [Armatimonadetes bacterium]|nr:MAG: hypothetical protein C4584_02065 [Armatimonadota bacterium]
MERKNGEVDPVVAAEIICEGNTLNLVQVLSLSGAIHQTQVETVVGEYVDWDDPVKMCKTIGYALSHRECLIPASVAFKLAFQQQIVEDEENPGLQELINLYISTLNKYLRIILITEGFTEKDKITSTIWVAQQYNTLAKCFNYLQKAGNSTSLANFSVLLMGILSVFTPQAHKLTLDSQ